MKRLTQLLSVAILVLGANALAEDKAHKDHAADPKMQEMMKKYEEASKPGEPHKALADAAGNWKTTSQMWHSAEAKPETTKGTAKFKMVLGGRWLQEDFNGTAMGKPFNGFAMIGYDNVKQKYETHWFDSMSTGAMKTEGDFDASSKTFKDQGTYSCPISEDKTQDVRTEWKFESKNKMIFSMYGKGHMDSGPEYKMMEVVYTR